MRSWESASFAQRASRVLEFAAASGRGASLVSLERGVEASHGAAIELRAAVDADWERLHLAEGAVVALSEELIVGRVGEGHLLIVQLDAVKASEPRALLRVRRACEVLARLVRSSSSPARPPPAPGSGPSSAPAELRVFAPARKSRPS